MRSTNIEIANLVHSAAGRSGGEAGRRNRAYAVSRCCGIAAGMSKLRRAGEHSASLYCRTHLRMAERWDILLTYPPHSQRLSLDQQNTCSLWCTSSMRREPADLDQ